jgi:hypothetical protein
MDIFPKAKILIFLYYNVYTMLGPPEPASYMFANNTQCLAGNKKLPGPIDFINKNFTSSLTGAIQ